MRTEVKIFAELMEKELAKHDDRPGWKNENINYLLGRLREEMIELERAIFPPWEAKPYVIGKEAADVANFAMMIADVCDALLTKDE